MLDDDELGYDHRPSPAQRFASYVKSLNGKTIGFIFLALLGVFVVGAIVFTNYPQSYDDNKPYEDRINSGELPPRTEELLYGCIGQPMPGVGPVECAKIRAKEWKDLLQEADIENNSALKDKHLWHLLWPLADCARKDRIGEVGEGGRWVCNAYKIHTPCAVYSFGMEENNFENFWSYACDVFIFDPDVNETEDGVSFHSIGLGPTGGNLTNPNWELSIKKSFTITRSLLNITKEFGLGLSPKLDILRIDIEGAEIYAVPYMLNEPGFDDLHIGQILLEFHYGGELNELNIILDIVNKLVEKEYYIFNIEKNDYSGHTNGVEVAFVHSSLLD